MAVRDNLRWSPIPRPLTLTDKFQRCYRPAPGSGWVRPSYRISLRLGTPAYWQAAPHGRLPPADRGSQFSNHRPFAMNVAGPLQSGRPLAAVRDPLPT